MAWAWVKEYTEKFLNASDTAKFDKRTVIGGMANIFGRSLIALGRIEYTGNWPPQLRSEFMYVWQSPSERRMFLSGWNLEPSKGGSPSKRYWQKVKAVAEALRNCWHLQPMEGWPTCEQEWVTTIGRLVYSADVFSGIKK